MTDVVKVAHTIPVSREMLGDGAPLMHLLDQAVDRVLNPWRYPDRNPMPAFDLFPRLTRMLVTPCRIFDEWRLRRDHRHCTCEDA